jgi:hypothetical protein
VRDAAQWASAFRAAHLAAHAGGLALHADWRGQFDRLESMPLAERQRATFDSFSKHRPLALSMTPIEGHDFACAEAERHRSGACEVACLSTECLEAYRLCLALDQCQAVQVANLSDTWVNTWAVLKTGAGDQADGSGSSSGRAARVTSMVASEMEWKLKLASAVAAEHEKSVRTNVGSAWGRLRAARWGARHASTQTHAILSPQS